MYTEYNTILLLHTYLSSFLLLKTSYIFLFTLATAVITSIIFLITLHFTENKHNKNNVSEKSKYVEWKNC